MTTLLCTPRDCAVHHLACTVQPRESTGMGQMFKCTRGGVVEYCASQNATPAECVNVTQELLKLTQQSAPALQPSSSKSLRVALDTIIC